MRTGQEAQAVRDPQLRELGGKSFGGPPVRWIARPDHQKVVDCPSCSPVADQIERAVGGDVKGVAAEDGAQGCEIAGKADGDAEPVGVARSQVGRPKPAR